MLNVLSDFFSPIVKSTVGPIVKHYFPDPADAQKARELEASIQLALMQQMSEQGKTLSNMVMAESKSESWMTRNWRPVAMFSFIFIILHDTVLEAYTQAIPGVQNVDVPEGVWTIMFAMFGIYGGDRALRYGAKAIGDAVRTSKK